MRIRGLGQLRRTSASLWKRLRERGNRSVLRDPGALARVVRQMAETGIGTDECLEQGCLPMRVHFYSPVPDIEDLKARRVWKRRSPMAGIQMREKQQLELLAELGREYGDECRWPHDSAGDKYQFFTNNTGFSYGCAAATHAIIRKYKPRRVIEVGSGSSSRVIAAALRMNAVETGRPADYTIVDPYPEADLQGLPGLSRVLKQRVELLELSLFTTLGGNDVLFVDSGHTVRIGGDVNFLVLDVLPVLAQGVIAHFHDIALPYEYAQVYFTNPRFRMFWTEAYLLQAFLCHNVSWEVLLSMNFLMLDHQREFGTTWRHYDSSVHRYPSHSFWIRRVRE